MQEATLASATAVSKPVPSMVTRMTAILDTFDSSYRSRSLQDISDLTGLPRSTAHRILDQLVRLGWVTHNGTGYTLGWRADRMPSRAEEDARLREAAANQLQELALRSQAIVHLAVLEGANVRYLDKVGVRPTKIPSRVGGRLPAHLTAVGKVMLAQLDADDLDQRLGLLRTRGDRPDEWVLLHRELATVRMRGGHAFSRNGPIAPVTCVGVPIFDRDNRVAGGLSICDGGSGAPVDHFVPMLLEGSRRISGQLDELRQRDSVSLSAFPCEAPRTGRHKPAAQPPLAAVAGS